MKFPSIARALQHLESCIYPAHFAWCPEQRAAASDALKEARDELAADAAPVFVTAADTKFGVTPVDVNVPGLTVRAGKPLRMWAEETRDLLAEVNDLRNATTDAKTWRELWAALNELNPVWFNDESEGVRLVLAYLRQSPRAVVPLTLREIELLSCMVWGAPVAMDDHTTTQIIVPVLRQYERLLQAGLRPQDPAAPDADPKVAALAVMHGMGPDGAMLRSADGYSTPAERGPITAETATVGDMSVRTEYAVDDNEYHTAWRMVVQALNVARPGYLREEGTGVDLSVALITQLATDSKELQRLKATLCVPL